MQPKINSLEELRALLKLHIALKGLQDFAFTGLWVRATTLIKAICTELGAMDIITSPTLPWLNTRTTSVRCFTI
jgi:hypothetical protein